MRYGANAFRLWNRAVDNLARIAVKYQSNNQLPVKPRVVLDDPFGAPAPTSSPQDAKALDEEQPKRSIATTTSESRLSGTHLAYTWVRHSVPMLHFINILSNQSLLESTLKLAQTHLTKGSAKQAEAYATQARHLASELSAGIWKAKASLMLAAIYIKTESLDQAKTVLAEAKVTLEEVCRLNWFHM